MLFSRQGGASLRGAFAQVASPPGFTKRGKTGLFRTALFRTALFCIALFFSRRRRARPFCNKRPRGNRTKNGGAGPSGLRSPFAPSARLLFSAAPGAPAPAAYFTHSAPFARFPAACPRKKTAVSGGSGLAGAAHSSVAFRPRRAFSCNPFALLLAFAAQLPFTCTVSPSTKIASWLLIGITRRACE